MTGDNHLLDTNIIIEVFDGNKRTADKIHQLSVFYVPVVVLGELYTGVNRVVNKAKHLKKISDFLRICTVLNVDHTTARQYGEIVASLYKKGRPLPLNDIWIGAAALQHELGFPENVKCRRGGGFVGKK